MGSLARTAAQPAPDSNYKAVVSCPSRGELAERLLIACRGRYLSGPAFREFCQLVRTGDERELRHVLSHLAHLPAIKAESIDVDEETTRRLLALLDERDERLTEETHKRVVSVRNLAWLLEQHRITGDEFKRRVGLVLNVRDPELPDVGLFGPRAIEHIVTDAVARTKRRGAPPSLLDGGIAS